MPCFSHTSFGKPLSILDKWAIENKLRNKQAPDTTSSMTSYQEMDDYYKKELQAIKVCMEIERAQLAAEADRMVNSANNMVAQSANSPYSNDETYPSSSKIDEVCKGAGSKGGGFDWEIVSDINGFVGIGSEWLKTESIAASKQVYKYGQSFYDNGQRFVKSSLQITRESKIFNLRAAKLFGRVGAKTVVANTVINGVGFVSNPTVDQGIWSSGMIGLGIFGIACPPILVYSVILDQVGKDGIRQVWEHDMKMYREYGRLPRPH